MMGDVHVWISDPEVAQELMARRSHLYLDRPGNPRMKDPKDSVEYLPFLRYGGMVAPIGHPMRVLTVSDKWIRQRKFATAVPNQAANAHCYHYPDIEAIRLLHGLLKGSSNYDDLIDQFTGRVTNRLG
jgi:hypothetical protein